MRGERRLLTLAILTLILIGAGLPVAPVTQAAETSGPLASLPSAPGPHVEKIKALGDGEWLDLGAPAPDPQWGGAPGRAYTNKMAYAPDLVGAFLQGEGVHGARGEGPRKNHYNDDIHFYDLMAHRYICLFPGSTEDLIAKVKVDAQGFAAMEDGQNLPHAIAAHGYECSSYNPDTGEFMTLLTSSPYSKKLMAQFPLKGKDSLHSRAGGHHPFFYNTRNGRWVRRKVEGAGPATKLCKALWYIPSLKQTVFYGRRTDLWFYDHATHAWTEKKFESAPKTHDGRPSSEGTICYDSKRDRLYIFNRDQVSIPAAYDFKQQKLMDLEAKNQPYPGDDYTKGVRQLASTTSTVHYDRVADVVVMRLCIKKGEGNPRNLRGTCLGLAIYDPNTNTWAGEPVPLCEAAQGRGCWNSFYSPELNVHVYHIAGDSRANGRVILYRHRKAE